MKSIMYFIRPLLVFIFSLAFISPATALPMLEARSNVPLTSLGGLFTVDIFAENVSDLFAYDFSLAYDPAVLRLLAINEGSLLSGVGLTFFVPATIDNTSGIASFTGNSLLGPISGASGDGVLATFNFQGIDFGTSALALSDVLFLDSSLNDIAVGKQDGIVSVASSTVPEPSSLFLLLLGLPFFLSPRWSWYKKRGVLFNNIT